MLGYSNYFQSKYVHPAHARQRSNSRAANIESRTIAVGKKNPPPANNEVPPHYVSSRPVLFSQQVSSTVPPSGLGKQLQHQGTFSRESVNAMPPGQRPYPHLINHHMNKNAVTAGIPTALSMQHSLNNPGFAGHSNKNSTIQLENERI